MLALAATPAHYKGPASSSSAAAAAATWHPPLRRATVRSQSHSYSSLPQPPEHHRHATPPHRSLSRATTTPHAPVAPHDAQKHAQQESVRPVPVLQAQPPAAPAPPLSSSSSSSRPVDIHAVPQQELIKHLANLLQQIAVANDALAAATHAPVLPALASVNDADRPPIWHSLTTASREAFCNQTTSLAFHARNIPTISLESYLLRILKYCPISNEVFLSLLVYFDRMTRLARETTGAVFAIDSYNVHRLVIAGITVASKFLSDVFYTNTRYAKVGGLPQAELNQLELQFLLLNDFHLLISKDEMQKYAEDLMAFAHSQTLPSLLADPASYEPQGANWIASRVLVESADRTDATSETYDDGGTTDDEPTIRPAHSSASSETQSIYTLTSDDTDAERNLDDDDDDDDDDDFRQ